MTTAHMDVAFVANGTLLATSGYDRAVRLWDVETAGVAVLWGHEGSVNKLAASADGATLLSAGTDETLILWDVAAREPAATSRP